MISGATGANMNGAAGDDSIIGGTGGDTITGGEGRDTIDAGDGNDTIVMTSTAADANDVIDGGDGNADTLSVAAGQTLVFTTTDANITNVENVSLGAAASVTLTGQSDGFTITSAGGAETIVASDGADSINAGLGNDVITGGAGADTIDGQAGLDTISYADVTLATSHSLAGIVGIAVNLTEAAITDTGTAGDIDATYDVITGAAGTYATGNNATTTLAAGTAQYIVETAGGAAKSADFVIDNYANVEGVIGSSLVDYIALGAGGMSASAGDGADAVFGNSGADTIDGGAGADSLVGNAGDDVITGGTGDDTIDAGAGNDTLVIDDADTDVDGGTGTDTAQIALDATYLAAEIDNIEAVELASDAELTVDFSDVNNGTVTDQIATVTGVADTAVEKLIVVGSSAGAGAVTHDYSASNLTLTSVDFEYQGGTDDETVIATAGADVLNGGDGRDVLTGGDGADTFLIQKLDTAAGYTALGGYGAADTDAALIEAITDFVVADDTIQLSTTTGAYAAGLDFQTNTSINVDAAVTLTADFATLAAMLAGLEAASNATASTNAIAQAIVVTVQANSTTVGDFDSDAAGTYLVIEDGSGTWDITDSIINITGVTGTITAADFTFV
jgi:Ca2+-binding RTX toxin-like protein